MTLLELFQLRTKLVEEFEENFSKMSFDSEKERRQYYSAFHEGMAQFFVNSMIQVMDSEPDSKKKAS